MRGERQPKDDVFSALHRGLAVASPGDLARPRRRRRMASSDRGADRPRRGPVERDESGE